MDRDQKKRSRPVAGGSGSGSDGGDRKKERETKAKVVETDPAAAVVVVPPPTEDEVDEFFAILRRMKEAVKHIERSKSGGRLPDPSPEAEEKKTNGALLDLNIVPDDCE